MNKQEFLSELRKGLSGLPQEDSEECLTFYSEMLEDRIEEGLSEEEAVLAVGSVEEVVRQTIADIPLAKVVKERMRSKRQRKAWEIGLLALGSPIWVSLGIAAAAVILALYVSLWAVVVSLWAVFGSLAVCAIVGVPACVISIAGGNVASGFAILAVGITGLGLSIFLFYGCRAVTKAMAILTKTTAVGIKKWFMGKEETE